jgi:hypothetical protein
MAIQITGITYAGVLPAEDNAAENEMLSKLSEHIP